MKKILNRSCQQDDVNTDKCLGTNSGYGIHEELYQKESGEFYLSGKGGVCSKYAVHCCGNLIAGSKIIPLTYESAQEWVKANLSAAAYQDIFGQSL